MAQPPQSAANPIVLLPNGNILIGAGSVASLYAPNGSLVTSFGVNGQTPGFAFNGAGGFVVSTNSTGVTRIISAGSIVTSPNLMFTHSVSGFLLVTYNTD